MCSSIVPVMQSSDCPTLDPYGQLLKELALACKDLDQGNDPLIGEAYALGAVIDFLQCDPKIRAGNLADPFIRLFADLNDILHGAKPPRFFKRERLSGATKPTNQWRDIMQGQIVGAANLLIRSGMTRRAAARWLETELAQQKMAHANRDPITGNQIIKWRERVNAGKASEASRLMADEVREHHAETADPTLENTKQVVRRLLGTIATMIPKNPPL